MLVDYHRRFLKRFAKLPPKIQTAFYNKLEIFKLNRYAPEIENHALRGEYLGCRSIKVTGDYRAIYSEKGEGFVFLKIGTHSELYGK